MGDIFLPADAAEAQRRRVMSEATDEMTRVVKAVPKMVAVADLGGARVHAAAGMLRRALELLEAARSADQGAATAPVVELALRSIFEITTRARHLLVCPDGPDEFVRMCRDYENRQQKAAKDSGHPAAGLPDFLTNALVGQTDKSTPRNLRQVCQALDVHDGRAASDPNSAEYRYVLLYGWLSNSATHAGLASINRFSRQENGVLHMVDHPEPLTKGWPVYIAAAYVGHLALDVFRAFDLPTDDLEEAGVMLA